jgi:NAD(P)-dependent dehydrogenase (short-subunit alcohol dehydrogenase family)
MQKHILITGCSSGIGLAAALQLHQRGDRVIATVRRQADIAPLTEQGLEVLLLDLDNADAMPAIVADILQRFDGRIDALFNNAAYGQPGAVEDLSRNVLRQQFETNVFGTQALTNLILPAMRQQGHGRIIYNSSVLGFVSFPYRGAYNASKYALEGLADTLRLELHDSGIHISLIEPGPIESAFRSNAFTKYKENITPEKRVHRQQYLAMEKRLSTVGPAVPFTLPASAVVKKLIHAIDSRRPKIRYYVTLPTYLFAILKRFLPHRLLDVVLRKIS